MATVAKARPEPVGKVTWSGVEAPRRMTFEEYMNLPEDNRRCELLSGWVVREPSPGVPHQGIVVNLCGLLLEYTRRTGNGLVYVGPLDIVLSRDYVVQPDLIYVASDRKWIISAKNIQGPPDLAVEVVSPHSGRKDRILRLQLYARFGIHEYWIVDPTAQTLEVFALSEPAGDGGEPAYEAAGVFTPGNPVRSRVLPGFAPDMAEVFSS